MTTLRHGHARKLASSTYQSWKAMKKRCQQPNAAGFDRYGGRGIAVCERWEHFENFLADMGQRPSGKSLERIDNDGDYDPRNCRWATPQEQGRNSSQTRFIEFRGERLCLRDWELRLGLSKGALWHRFKSGMAIDVALTTPKVTR